MKKIVSMILFLSLFTVLFSGCKPDAKEVIYFEGESNGYCNYILVAMKREDYQFGKKYSPADFDEELVRYVEIGNQIDREEYENEKFANWRPSLYVYLKEPTSENFEKVLEKVMENPEVETAYHLKSIPRNAIPEE